MKKQLLIYTAVVVFACIITGFNIISSDGKAGSTGAPGEQTCVFCHSAFDLNAGDGEISLSNTELESANWEFIGGQTYNLQLNIEHDGASLFGFGLEVLNAEGEDAGTLSVSDGDETQLKIAANRTNILHIKNGGQANNTKTFNFEWTAPDDMDEVVFYFAGNAANNDGMSSGDYIYSGSQKATRNITGINSSVVNIIRSYPNPTSEIINLSIPKFLTQYLVYIYNSNGQLIDIKAELSFSVYTYEKGIYYAVVTDEHNKPTLKTSFIKL